MKGLTTTTTYLLFALLLSARVAAQPIDIGLNIGAMAYNGDLSPYSITDQIQQIRSSIGIFARTSLSQKFSAKLSINYGSIDGDDARTLNASRGLSFVSKIVEANVTGELHLIRIRHTESSFTYPYIFGGIGVFHFNPKAKQADGTLVALQPLGTEGQGLPGYEKKYARTQFNIPFGVGIRFILSDRWSVSLEAGARYLRTDYIDDVSATSVSYLELLKGNGPTAAQFSNPQISPTEPVDLNYRRGSPLQDWYYQTGILVAYNFGDALRKAFRDPVPCFSKW